MRHLSFTVLDILYITCQGLIHVLSHKQHFTPVCIGLVQTYFIHAKMVQPLYLKAMTKGHIFIQLLHGILILGLTLTRYLYALIKIWLMTYYAQTLVEP